MLTQCAIKSAQQKIIICFLLSIAALLIRNIFLLSIILGLVLLVLMFNQIKWQQLKPFFIVGTYTILIILFMHAWSHSLHTGIIVSLQMSIIIFTSCFLVQTSREMDLVNAAENLIQPLKKLGVNTEKIGLSLWLSVRAIGLLARHYSEIKQAQQARGLHKSMLAILMPLLIKTFQSAQHLTDALIAKGYEVE